MLEVRDLQTAYGRSQVLFGVELTIQKAEVVSLLGRNGMGKTTTVRSIMGITPARSGTILFQGKPIQRLASYRVAKAGIGLVPEGRQVFPNLTVHENLVATARKGAWNEDRVLKLFPHLEARKDNYGNQLSGGEQQMLAIGRALMAQPRLLLLDEPSLGLAPLLVKQIFGIVREINAQGTTVVLVEQNARQALRVARRAYVLETGQLALEGSAETLARDPRVRAAYLGEESPAPA